jgi:cytochrome c-type biogenesis protein CcmH
MTTLFRLSTLVVLLHLSGTTQCAAVDAQSEQVNAQARELFNSLMSPYCPGSLLSACPSSQAAVLRDSVRARLQRGQSPDEVRQGLVAIYGNEILASPPFAGLGSVTWMGVALIFLGGFAAAVSWIRHRHRSTTATAVAPTAAPADLERLRREIAEQDRD